MNKCKFMLILILIIVLSGCWDMVAIEDQGIIIGTAIDLSDNDQSKNNNELTLTNQFVVPSKLGTPSIGQGSEAKAFVNISANGDSMYAIDQEMASLTSKTPFFQHIKVLVVSEELATIPNFFTELLDIYIRDTEMRRGIKVILADGKAKDILEIHPEDEPLPAMFIDKLLETSFKSTGQLKPLEIGKIHEFHLKKMNYTIPKVSRHKNRLKYEGGAVFHGHLETVVGVFTKEEIMGLNLITGEKQGGTIEVDFEGHLITFQIQDVNSQITLTSKDINHLTFDIKISVEGNVKEVFGTKNLTKEKNLKALERTIAEKVGQLANDSLMRGQTEFNADVFGFEEILSKRHTKLWNKVKKNWDHGENYFSKINVNINPNVEIHTTGSSEKSDIE